MTSNQDVGSIVPETDEYAYTLYICDYLREPVSRSAVKELDLPPGSSGLDAGCGIGSHTPLLAEAVGPSGQITGVDISSKLLDYARKIADKRGLLPQCDGRLSDLRQHAQAVYVFVSLELAQQSPRLVEISHAPYLLVYCGFAIY